MNTEATKQLVEEYGIVTVKADMTHHSPSIEELLVELGNPSKGIPFYAIYPSDGREPITYAGLLTQDKVIAMIKEAGPSRVDLPAEDTDTRAEEAARTAMTTK